ncbi:MAG: CpaF family protein [Leptolinea sp.]
MALLKRFNSTDSGNSSLKDNSVGGNSGNNDPNRPVTQTPTQPRSGLSNNLATSEGLTDFKNRVQNKLLATLEPTTDMSRKEELRLQIERVIDEMILDEHITIARPEKIRLYESVCSEILGFGPLETLLEDEAITEIMVNGAKSIYVEKRGRLIKANVTFESNDHVLRIIDRIVSPLGRRIDESSPYVDARLPDGSRVNAVIPPISLNGPVLTIRKFSKRPITVEQLLGYGSVTPEALHFLKACVEARLNIIISGGTGSGKTTLLNVLSSYIPSDERIITIESPAELQLQQEHVVTMESRPMNIEGKGEITIRQLVVNALRMRPDRIIVGEIRDEAALDMLQAMNTGHDGSMTTAHSNGPRDTLSRLETMVLMAGMDLPVRAIREQVSSAINLIIHQDRLRDGTRKITYITEVMGMEGDIITATDIFTFEQAGIENNQIIGMLRPSGMVPKFMDKIRASGINLPTSLFGVGKR